MLAALFVVLASGKAEKPDVTSSFLTDKPAPAVVSTTLDGKTFDLSRRKGSWVVLNFFQSTCLPCKAEHPELVAFAAQQAGIADGAELYTVIKDDPDDAVAKWFAEHGGDWPIVKDDDGAIATAFGVATGARDVDHRSVGHRCRSHSRRRSPPSSCPPNSNSLRQAYG